MNKIFFILITFSFFVLPQLKATSYNVIEGDSVRTIPEYVDKDVKSRLRKIKSPFKLRYNSHVRKQIKGYALRARSSSESIIERAAIYMPIIEKYIAAYDVPEAFKYLPIVESRFKPLAESRVGAVGLWQFMPETAAGLDLQFNEFYDDRCSLSHSTKAAIEYLIKLHDRFGDWTLALAAYNSGPGRVSKAIRKAGSKDYWKIRPFLPKETRNYVPAFYAAIYIMNFYEEHDLEPQLPALDLQLTQSLYFEQPVTFEEIAWVTKLPVHYILELNPGYKSHNIPKRLEGHTIILPKRVVGCFIDYLNFKKEENYYFDPAKNKIKDEKVIQNTDNKYYMKLVHEVELDQSLEEIAQLYDVEVFNLMLWNNLFLGYELNEGDELYVYLPRENVTFKKPVIEKMPSVQFLKTLDFKRLIAVSDLSDPF